MQRTLYIVRHAKAEDRGPFGSDHERDLTSDGIVAAARVGRHLHIRGIKPDQLLSSTANRARDTAKVMAEQLSIDPEQVVMDDHLYGGGPRAYLAAVNALPDATQTAMIVGHNPDVSYFSEFLTHQSVGSMSKGAIIAITFNDLRWDEVSGRTGTLAFQVSPKELTE
ncbi:MAG: histidine phosphatase family protein [Rudanella sp.]|nr:histidine phosphatase family protein [Rudanella sp.]